MVSYAVEVTSQPRRPIAVVAWETSGDAFPAQWRDHLDEVYAWLRRTGTAGGANVMRYQDRPGPGRIAVQVGVEVSGTFPPAGRVQPAELPAGPAAVTIHRGPYSGLGAGHEAVLSWCAAHGHELTGERWEVYGDWHEDPAQLETGIFYRLAGASG